MAVAVVNSAQTASAATATLGVAATTAGNILVVFVSQSVTTSAPTMTGYVFNGTSSPFNTGASSLFVGTRTADGTETTLAPTAGAGGTIQGICYYEVSGAQNSLENITVASSSSAGGTTLITMTTTTANDMLLLAVGSQASTGTVGSPWAASSGSSPTTLSTVATRCIGGSLPLTGTISAVTYGVTWTNSHVFGIMGLGLLAATGGNMLLAF